MNAKAGHVRLLDLPESGEHHGRSGEVSNHRQLSHVTKLTTGGQTTSPTSVQGVDFDKLVQTGVILSQGDLLVAYAPVSGELRALGAYANPRRAQDAIDAARAL